MERIFPRVLIGCISEGRSPENLELEQLSRKVESEIVVGRTDEKSALKAMAIARVAMQGSKK